MVQTPMSASSRNTILVIDPDPSVRVLILALLRREGYRADAADNADDALRLRETCRHDAVVVDPHVDAGDSLLHALQTGTDGGTHARNVIVVTTPDDSEETYAGRPGVRAVLYKPLFLNDLAAAVAACCNSAS